jgi:cysteine dioxygenase
MHQGSCYQALILCWRNGQRSPIHDHKGSSCGVKILQGEATETVFTYAKNGMIIPTVTKEYPVGMSMGSQDADIHQVSNLAADGECLITLHIYSPPLEVMNVYSLMGGEEQRTHDYVVSGARTT